MFDTDGNQRVDKNEFLVVSIAKKQRNPFPTPVSFCLTHRLNLDKNSILEDYENWLLKFNSFEK